MRPVARPELKPKVLELRKTGKTWQQIGDALGITRSFAHKIGHIDNLITRGEDTMNGLILNERELARFWKQVDKRGPDECWNWLGYTKGAKREYGGFFLKRKNRSAHRVSCVIHGIRLQEGRVVDHLCNNKRCVNPAHLKPDATTWENIRRGNSPIAVRHRAKRGQQYR